MDLDCVNLSSVPEHREVNLKNQLNQMNAQGCFTDTRLVCSDGEVKVNSLIAGLSLPELYSSCIFNSYQVESIVILPDHSLSEILEITGLALTASDKSDSTHLEEETSSIYEIEKQTSKEDNLDQTEPVVSKEEVNHWTSTFVVQSNGSVSCNLCRKSIRKRKNMLPGIESHLLKNHSEIFKSFCLGCTSPLVEARQSSLDIDSVSVYPEEKHDVVCSSCRCSFHQGCVDLLNSDWCIFCKRMNEETRRNENVDEINAKKASLCPHCGKEFRHLSQHIKFFHLGQVKHTPVECHICKKTYTQKSHLKEHIRAVHEQIKEHKCNFCGREFYRKIHFRRHMKSMHMHIQSSESVSCPDCGKRLKSKNALYKHRRVVHLGIRPEKTLFCEDCGQSFTQSGSLYSHMRRVHAREPNIPKNRTNVYKDKVFVETNLILQVHPELKSGLL